MNKSYYAIIPASVRYDERITANAKLLYGEITALCNEKGFCWASNGYFSELYDVHKNTISKWISSLKECGYIDIEIITNGDGSQTRKLFISVSNTVDPINPTINPPKQKDLPPSTKTLTPLNEIVDHNNTINNTVNTTNILYDHFILLFNENTKRNFRKTDKTQKSFNARIKDGYTLESIVDAIKKAASDKYIIENGYLTPEYILRPDMLEKWLNKPLPTTPKIPQWK